MRNLYAASTGMNLAEAVNEFESEEWFGAIMAGGGENEIIVNDFVLGCMAACREARVHENKI
jgi:hypothetical protein